MPSPAASVEARAVMMETWAQPLPEAATALAGEASATPVTRVPTVAATATNPRRRARDMLDGCTEFSLLVGAGRRLRPEGPATEVEAVGLMDGYRLACRISEATEG